MSFVDRAIAILGDIGDNRRNLAALEQHRTRLVPFVGAGLSIDFGYPNWADLLKSLAPDDKIKAEVEILLKHYQYEEAAELIADAIPPRDFRKKLKEAFDEAKLPKTITGAMAALPAFANSLVITTNLDRALEHAYQQAKQPFQNELRGHDLHEGTKANQRVWQRCLLKLHGDYADSKPILTKENYEAAYGSDDPAHPNLELPLPRLLNIILGSRALLFLGCSLEADRTVRVLAEGLNGLGVEHFALLSSAEITGANTAKRLRQLEKWKIKPIFYPKGEYAKIEAFLTLLPTEATRPAAPGSVDAMVREARAYVESAIRQECGIIKILDMTQSVSLETVYTEVNILEELRSHEYKTTEEFRLDFNQATFHRFGVHKVKQARVSGLKAVEQHRRLLIYGQPGAGKTTFLKRLAIECMGGRFHGTLVPVFIELRTFARAKGKPGLAAYVQRAIGQSTETLLREGRILLLLDGLDEVQDADFSRVREQVDAVAKQYDKLPIVMTCRIAARAYAFQHFRDVEMADFDQTQIETFSRNWFQARKKPERAGRFLDRLKASHQLLELANKPLLLTLLCLIFEKRGDFDGSRASLYQQGLDTLFHTWDSTRDIERRKVLDLEVFEDLLEQLAYEGFSSGKLLFERKQLQQQITSHLASRPKRTAGLKPATADQVLGAAESQLGLLVQRAKDIYSFSHLTFQEFLTARRISRNDGLLAAVAANLGETSWREVWRLLANLKDKNSLLPRLKLHIDLSLAGDPTLRELLSWAARKSSAVGAGYKPAAQRSSYVWLALVFDNTNGLDLDLALDLARRLARALDRALDLYRPLDRALNLALDRDLTRVVDPVLALDRTRDLNLAVARIVARAKAYLVSARRAAQSLSPDLVPHLNRLERTRPSRSAAYDEWAQWAADLQAIMIEHRDLGHDWKLTREDYAKLRRYLAANQLLVDMMNESRTLTQATRDKIESEMLLPFAQLYPNA